MSVRRWLAVGAISFVGSLAVVTVAGCGGSVGASRLPRPVPIVGHFVGTWDQPMTGEHGRLDWTVSSNGELTGTVTDNVDGAGSMGGALTKQKG